MNKKKLERKLRKKARKLAKWGKRHGIPYVSMFYMLDGYEGQGGDFFYVRSDMNDGTKFSQSGYLGDEDE